MKKLSWLSENGYHVLLDRLQDGIFAIEKGTLIYVNQRLAEMLGYPVEQLIGRSFIEMIDPDDRHMVLERHHARLAGKVVPDHYDMCLFTAQKKKVLCSLNVGLGENRVGGTVTVGSIRDVTIQREALLELEKSKADLKSIFDKLPDILYRTDMQGTIIMVSPSCFDHLGYCSEELLGTPLATYYCASDERQKVVQAITDGGGKAIQVEARLRHKDGSPIWFSSNAAVQYDSAGVPVFIEGIARDISKRKAMEEQLILLSRTDGLTGAYNRRHFVDNSEDVIGMMKRYHRPASLLIADIDHFKTINDNYGHHAGDISLQAFTNVCREGIRESDILGRLGGEEFGMLLPETSIHDAQILAERIRKAVSVLEIKLGDQIIRLTVSIGLVELGTDDVSIDAAMRRADLAMYQAKMRGRNQVVALMEQC